MCGIIAGVSQRDITPIFIEGLRRLEYRGYDSAGIALLSDDGLQCIKVCGKVNDLAIAVEAQGKSSLIGIGHTRWATHGKPNTSNAHPQVDSDTIALVHNGIIDNYADLKKELEAQGVLFESETDTEVIVKLIGLYGMGAVLASDFALAIRKATARLRGAFALAIISKHIPDTVFAVRQGSPLLIGVGIGEHFVASDRLALLTVKQFVILEEGDLALIRQDAYEVFDKEDKPVKRAVRDFTGSQGRVEKGAYKHFMQKEIFEQPVAISQALSGRLGLEFSESIEKLLDQTRCVHIVACGTSYHAGMIAKFWIENLAGIPCKVEVASEMRYHIQTASPGTLFVALSQSGETADTLAALRSVRNNSAYCGVLSICNVPDSALVREADAALLTNAGPEIGVATTKAFSTQLVCLLLLACNLGRRAGLSRDRQESIIQELRCLPSVVERVLDSAQVFEHLAESFVEKAHALFLGRGIHYPVAMEGALKLTELSYIHAQAYPAGELKHGPLALVDKHMPVIALLANDHLVEKLRSNMEVVSARGGELFVFDASERGFYSDQYQHFRLPVMSEYISPIVMTIPLQLLAYHVAVLKGTDVDQPRNLAKSVTVE